MRSLVLAGGGHAHALVLKAFAAARPEGLRVVLVTDAAHVPYSGMVPGVVAGRYREEEALIDVAALAVRAGADVVLGKVIGVDAAARVVRIERDGVVDEMRYDVLSVNVGAATDLDTVPGAREAAWPVKPMGAFLARLRGLAALPREPRVVVVGAGAAGVELAFALKARLGARAKVTLVGREAVVVPTFSRLAQWRLRRALERYGVRLSLGTGVRAVQSTSENDANASLGHADERGRVGLSDDRGEPFDALIWAVPAAAPSWIRASGLSTDASGFLAVGATLQSTSHPEVFAAGDVAAFTPRPLPKSGVYAVREAAILEANLRAVGRGTALRRYRPQKSALALIGTGDGRAFYVRGSCVFHGAWAYRLKDRIDRRFMDGFR